MNARSNMILKPMLRTYGTFRRN